MGIQPATMLSVECRRQVLLPLADELDPGDGSFNSDHFEACCCCCSSCYDGGTR